MQPMPHLRNFTFVSDEEIMSPGHVACPGCGAAIAMRLALKALGRRTILVIPACCWAVIDGPFPYSASGVPVYQTAFETAAITAGAIRAGLEATGKKDINVVAWAGDGGTFDIGFGQLSAAAERGDDIIYVCYDNEAYMNTGIQRSSATPWGAWTTTTPGHNYKRERKKNIMEIMAAHRIPYAATATVAYPDDLILKFQRARQIQGGLRFIHIFSPCPPGHKALEKDSILEARYAVESRVFPLYEIYDGVRYRLTFNPPPRPVEDYLVLQGRFKHLTTSEKEQIFRWVQEDWDRLVRKIQESDQRDLVS